MVIKLLQQSTFRRYAAKVLSPFFYFLLFSMCNYAVNRCDKLCFAFIVVYTGCVNAACDSNEFDMKCSLKGLSWSVSH